MFRGLQSRATSYTGMSPQQVNAYDIGLCTCCVFTACLCAYMLLVTLSDALIGSSALGQISCEVKPAQEMLLARQGVHMQNILWSGTSSVALTLGLM